MYVCMYYVVVMNYVYMELFFCNAHLAFHCVTIRISSSNYLILQLNRLRTTITKLLLCHVNKTVC